MASNRNLLVLPGDGAFAMLPLEMTPCGGYVRVSPFRPTAEDEAPASPPA